MRNHEPFGVGQQNSYESVTFIASYFGRNFRQFSASLLQNENCFAVVDRSCCFQTSHALKMRPHHSPSRSNCFKGLLVAVSACATAETHLDGRSDTAGGQVGSGLP